MADKAKGMVFIVIAIMVLSGCTSALEMNRTLGADSISSTATYTQAPIITSTPTADPFAGLNVCHTWREAKEKCIVTLEDLTSGKLVDYARAVSKPFPEDALSLWLQPYPISSLADTYYFCAVETDGTTEDEATIAWMFDGEWHANNEVFSSPRSPIGDKFFFWIKADAASGSNLELIVEVVKIKNKDGSDGYYTGVQFPCVYADGSFCIGPAEQPDLTAELYDTVFEDMAYQAPINDTTYLLDSENWMNTVGRNSEFLRNLAQDVGGVNKKLTDQWQATGNIPKDLEKRPLLLNLGGSPSSPFFK